MKVFSYYYSYNNKNYYYSCLILFLRYGVPRSVGADELRDTGNKKVEVLSSDLLYWNVDCCSLSEDLALSYQSDFMLALIHVSDY